MNNQEKIDFKNALKEKCIEIIEQRIFVANFAMANAQAAANEEEKSSAGDKYETGRAMSHLEKDMYANQSTANKKDMAALLSVTCNQIYENVKQGCFIKCTGISFFIAAGLGKIIVEEKTVFLLSPNAPLAKILYNKKSGDKILFKDKKFSIEDIF